MIEANFQKRLNELIEYYDLTAATFADKIGVPRSSISHILSGRNNPSLDFVLKIMTEFKEVDFDWLVLGKGSFPVTSNKSAVTTLFDDISSVKVEISTPEENMDVNKVEKKDVPVQAANNDIKNSCNELDSTSVIERIVIFFTNGTFKNYRP